MRKVIRSMLYMFGAFSRRNNDSKILFYHDVYAEASYKSLDSDILMGTDMEVFKKHIKTIQNEGYIIVPRITQPQGQVCIMFDDGFRGIWDNRHWFYEHQITPTIFLAVDLIGKEGFLNDAEILDLQLHGFVFQCHTWSHRSLARMSDEKLDRELGESKAYLSKLLGHEVTEVCLPRGYFSDKLLTILPKYGYQEVYSSVPGSYHQLVCGFMRPRNICQFASPTEVKYILRGGNLLDRVRIEKLHHKKDR